MSGHVFHPGHADLHGVTVVVETLGEVLYVGRYHEMTPKGLLLHDVAEHRPEGDKLSREEFMRAHPQVRGAGRPPEPGAAGRGGPPD